MVSDVVLQQGGHNNSLFCVKFTSPAILYDYPTKSQKTIFRNWM